MLAAASGGTQKLSREVAATIERARATGWRFLMIDMDVAMTMLRAVPFEPDAERVERAIAIAEKVLATVDRFKPGLKARGTRARALDARRRQTEALLRKARRRAQELIATGKRTG